jgi:hypothetical protein
MLRIWPLLAIILASVTTSASTTNLGEKIDDENELFLYGIDQKSLHDFPSELSGTSNVL